MTEKVAQLVIGPAGTGKTTYCKAIEKYCNDALQRVVHVVNLDPATLDAERTSGEKGEEKGREEEREREGGGRGESETSLDIRNLIALEDVLAEHDLGPNGGLIYCMEYFADNIAWFLEQLDDYAKDYLLIDCPGQLELYSHLDTMKTIVEALVSAGYSVCTVYLLDSTFLGDPSRFVTGSLVALSSMAQFECPHVNVVSKIDLLKERCFAEENANKREKSEKEEWRRKNSAIKSEERREKSAASASTRLRDDQKMHIVFQRCEKYFDANMNAIVGDLDAETPPALRALNRAIGTMLGDSDIIRYVPLDITCADSVGSLMQIIDRMTQYEQEESFAELTRDNIDQLFGAVHDADD